MAAAMFLSCAIFAVIACLYHMHGENAGALGLAGMAALAFVIGFALV